MSDLTEKVALVTGGSRGIGLAVAGALLEAGAHVWITATGENSLEKGLAALRHRDSVAGARVFGMTVDVREQTSIEALLAKICMQSGRLDILVNNAGIGGGGVTLKTPDHQWFDIIDVNLHGVYRMTREALRCSGMLERRWGRIINIASTGGKQGVVMAAAYTASKHAVVGFTKSLGLELAKSGITVNAICPGFVETELSERARRSYSEIWGISASEVKSRFEQRIPLGRYVEPSEIGPLAVYLASPTAAAVVAQAINICGGLGNY